MLRRGSQLYVFTNLIIDGQLVEADRISSDMPTWLNYKLSTTVSVPVDHQELMIDVEASVLRFIDNPIAVTVNAWLTVTEDFGSIDAGKYQLVDCGNQVDSPPAELEQTMARALDVCNQVGAVIVGL